MGRRISSYGLDLDIEGSDKLTGTDGSGGSTVNITLDQILGFIGDNINDFEWSLVPTEAPVYVYGDDDVILPEDAVGADGEKVAGEIIPGRVWNDQGTLKIT